MSVTTFRKINCLVAVVFDWFFYYEAKFSCLHPLAFSVALVLRFALDLGRLEAHMFLVLATKVSVWLVIARIISTVSSR